MLTLKRFGTLAASYGGDLQRWPLELREEAQALLNVSAAARAILDDARMLDDDIAAARDFEATRSRPDEQGAALARLRASVAARIAAPIDVRRPGRRPWSSVAEGFVRLRSVPFPVMGAAGASAILAGLLVGAISVSEPATDSVLAALLQPAPIHRLWD